jgi:cell fate (sporulation/competence/biofilm development) regulator YlbF (YheA/YmcA/DUF963 family)
MTRWQLRGMRAQYKKARRQGRHADAYKIRLKLETTKALISAVKAVAK